MSDPWQYLILALCVASALQAWQVNRLKRRLVKVDRNTRTLAEAVFGFDPDAEEEPEPAIAVPVTRPAAPSYEFIRLRGGPADGQTLNWIVHSDMLQVVETGPLRAVSWDPTVAPPPDPEPIHVYARSSRDPNVFEYRP